MALKYLAGMDGYSIYEDENGDTVYLADGGFRRLVVFDEVDLLDDWETWLRNTYLSNRASAHYSWRAEWVRSVKERITKPEYADDIVWCLHCYEPSPMDKEGSDCHSVRDGYVCSSCIDEYNTCTRCDELVRYTTECADGADVCESCRSRWYHFCDGCDEWMHDEVVCHHDDDDGCCESPALEFTVRNDGEPPLPNDTRVTVELAAGVISEEGLNAIEQYLRDKAYEIDDLEERNKLYTGAWQLDVRVGAMWQTREGNFTKRLSRYLYKNHAFKLSPTLLSQVGVIAREHSDASSYEIEVTRDLNQPSTAFGNDGSCWWSDYNSGRCGFKTNGGFGIRAFDSLGQVTGRAWVMPLKQTGSTEDGVPGLRPTFDTDAEAFVVFNCYGAMRGYVAPRVFAHMAGLTYRKVSFKCSPMWVNSDNAYLVAAESIATHYTDGSLSLSVNEHSTLFQTEQAAREDMSDVA